jgi:NAD(P)-dependent dehydrogenase (short-subunit alcohol dehydrogenase family)
MDSPPRRTIIMNRHINPSSRSAFRRALITGASRGLGRALAEQLAQDGTLVVGVARHEAELRAALEPIGGLALVADIGRDDADALAARGQALAGGPFDLIIHAAGALGPLQDGEDPMPRLVSVDAASLRQVFEVNTLGPARLIRSLHRSMREEGGTIAVISSDAAVEAYPGWGAYGASKLALDHLLRVWALEEEHLRFVSFDPGEMDTVMHAAAFPSADPQTLKPPAQAAAELLALLARAPSAEIAVANG